MDESTRDELLEHLADVVGAGRRAHPTRVAVDGPPAAGKTTLADELADVLRARGRVVVRATIEGFLHPRAQRHRRGVDSPEGCYEDSFDLDALRRELLDPLGPGGDRQYRPAIYDREADLPSSPPIQTVPDDAVLLFDGVFLLRPELVDRWDVRIHVAASFEETVLRARVRDATALGSADRVEERFRARYRPSQAAYADAVRPTGLADVVVHNDDPQRPRWVSRP